MTAPVVRLLDRVIEITQLRDRELIGAGVVKTLADQIPCRSIWLYKVQRSANPIELSLQVRTAAHGELTAEADDEELAPPVAEAIAACLESGAMVERTLSDPTGSLKAYPVLVRGGRVGSVLLIEQAESAPDGTTLVKGVLSVYENYCALLDDSQSDKLTGLLNRKTFDDQIFKFVAGPIQRPVCVRIGGGQTKRVRAESLHPWLAIIDIDHFKRINDTFGHVYGDEVLILLSRLMMENFRSDDLLFRFGGEEFVVLYRTRSEADGEGALERFRQTVEAYDFPQVGKRTISIGYTRITSVESPVVLVGQADEALYYAKEHGRNRVCGYETLVASGALVAQKPKPGDIELF